MWVVVGVCVNITQYYMRALGIYRSLHGKLSWIPRDNGASFLSDGTEVELESRAGAGRGESRVSFLRQTSSLLRLGRTPASFSRTN